MKQILKKISLILSCFLMMSLIGGCGKKTIDEGLYGNQIKWTLYKDGSLVFEGKGEMSEQMPLSASAVFKEHRKDITRLEIKEGITSIGKGAFSKFSALSDVSLPDSLTVIGESAFSDCSSLESLTIPDQVTTIGASAFVRCKQLKNITLPSSVIQLGESAFAYCESLTQVQVPDGVEILPYHVFVGCKKLTSITLPDSLREVGSGALTNCESLSHVSFSNHVTKIHAYAFENCPNLQAITIAEDHPTYETIDGALFDKKSHELIWYPESVVANSEIFVPDALKNNNVPQDQTLDVKSAMAKKDIQIIPLTNKGTFNRKLYNLMPVNKRTWNFQKATYALVQTIGYEERNDYVYKGTTTQAKGVKNTLTYLYLCTKDGAYGQMCMIRKTPPVEGYSTMMKGRVATAQELYNAIKDQFPDGD